MSLKKNFLSPRISELEISKRDFAIGIFIGLLFSFGFYSFLVVGRELFRIMSIQENFCPWIIRSAQIHQYNLFSAFWAVLMGQSFSFNYWMTKPIKAPIRIRIRRKSILNDQRNLSWSFTFVFTHIFFILGLLFGFGSNESFLVLDDFESYRFIFYLIIIVLFLNSFLGIRLLFKRYSLKYMLISAIAVSILSFSISRINVVDSERINRRSKNHSFSNLHLPEATGFEYVHDYYLNPRYYIAYSEQDSNIEMFYWKEKIEREDFRESLYRHNSRIALYHSKRVKVLLFIDKKVSMKYINELRKDAAGANMYRIYCAVVPPKKKFKDCYYLSNALVIPFVRYSDSLSYFPPPPPKPDSSIFWVFDVEQSSADKYIIANELVSDLKAKFKSLILRREKKRFLFNYKYNPDSTSLADYIKLYSIMRSAIMEIRDQKSKELYNKPFNELDYENRRSLQRAIPMAICEDY